MRRLIEDMLDEQAALAGAVMANGARSEGAAGVTLTDAEDPAASAKRALLAWSSDRGDAIRAAKRTLEEIERAPGGWSFAKLTLANSALRGLVAG